MGVDRFENTVSGVARVDQLCESGEEKVVDVGVSMVVVVVVVVATDSAAWLGSVAPLFVVGGFKLFQ
jgi:hypothetical protein